MVLVLNILERYYNWYRNLYHRKKDFLDDEKGKVQVPLLYCALGILGLFCTSSAESVDAEEISEASKSGRYSCTVRQPLYQHPHMIVSIVVLFTVRLVTVPRQLPKIITVNMSTNVVTCHPDIRI